MNIVLDKKALKEWEEKMKEMNREYNEKYGVYSNEKILYYENNCKNCYLKFGHYKINQNYPIEGYMKVLGIYWFGNNICKNCSSRKYVPYPNNY